MEFVVWYGMVWAPWTAEEKQVLEREQQQAVEMISGLKGHTYEEKCKEIGLETLERRREHMNRRQTYKIVAKVDKVDKNMWFKMAAENAERVTGAGQKQRE